MLSSRPVVLTVAGSDCSGGAGIQADIKTIEANGAHAAAAVTAVTAQTPEAFFASEPVSAGLLRRQLEAVLEVLPVAAVKSGMLVNGSIVRELARALRAWRGRHYVCDPVLESSTGAALIDADGIRLLRAELFPRASLVTPNVAEAERLSGVEIRGALEAERAARAIIADGAAAVLVKGGHRADRPGSDLLVTPLEVREFSGEWIASAATRGTGCRLASAIATGLARGRDLDEAIVTARRFVADAIRQGVRA